MTVLDLPRQFKFALPECVQIHEDSADGQLPVLASLNFSTTISWTISPKRLDEGPRRPVR
jgi:hypothetical protein